MKSRMVIYRYADYKKYLLAVEDEFSRFDRGFRSRLAESLEVQSAFISKVLNQDKVHFTLEQGMKLAGFLKLKPDETSYLIWMLELSRAGTKELRDFFAKLIEQAQSVHLNIKNRVGEAIVLNDMDQARYYSHWLYQGAHVLSSISQYNKPEEMAQALKIDLKHLREILSFLVETGVVQRKGDSYVVGNTQVHLSKASPNIAKHHSNWRVKAIDDAADPSSDGIHYSAASSISVKDFEKMRHELTEVIQNYVSVIRDSKDETAVCFNLDFFKLIKN